MDTITTAIATNNPRLVKDLIRQGWIVGPNDVKNLLKQTSRCQSAEVLLARLELSQIAIDLKATKPMSFAKLQSLPYNHIKSPMGLMKQMEEKFEELLDLWAKEIA
jgi:hypothetical protein